VDIIYLNNGLHVQYAQVLPAHAPMQLPGSHVLMVIIQYL